MGPHSESIFEFEPGDPCPGARHSTTVGGLDTTVPVWTAAKATLTDAWTCGDAPVLMYGGIQVAFEPGWEKVDARAKWTAMVDRSGGSVQTILGSPAWVHPADVNGRLNGVELVIAGTNITVLAKSDVPISDLVDLAKSLRPVVHLSQN